MYRVLFKVIKVCIHIKETLYLEILLRKNVDTIVSKELYPLVNGKAELNMTTQFLITKDNPFFELQVNFNFKNIKKQAGFIVLNLNDWICGNSYLEIRTLSNAPCSKGIIEFGFTYLDSGIVSLPKELVSLQQFDREFHKSQYSQIQKDNDTLEQKLKYLKAQKDQLVHTKEAHDRDKNLSNRTEAFYVSEMSFQKQKMIESSLVLKEEQKKTAFLMKLIKNSGSQELIESIKNMDNIDGECIESQTSQI